MNIVNPIQKLVLTKVKILIEKQKLADAIEHSTSKGDLRENFLKEFIQDIIPDEYDTTTGFIASHNQNKLSPQIDLIINEKIRTPKFLLHENKSIIPFESTFLMIEIKTVITSKIIEQINNQNKFIDDCGNPQYYNTHLLSDLKSIENKLGITFTSTNNLFDKPLIFVIAFSSELSKETLMALFFKVKVLGIWIVDKFFIYVKDNSSVEVKEGDEASLFAVESILQNISIMNLQRQYHRLNWTQYLKT